MKFEGQPLTLFYEADSNQASFFPDAGFDASLLKMLFLIFSVERLWREIMLIMFELKTFLLILAIFKGAVECQFDFLMNRHPVS